MNVCRYKLLLYSVHCTGTVSILNKIHHMFRQVSLSSVSPELLLLLTGYIKSFFEKAIKSKTCVPSQKMRMSDLMVDLKDFLVAKVRFWSGTESELTGMWDAHLLRLESSVGNDCVLNKGRLLSHQIQNRNLKEQHNTRLDTRNEKPNT